MFKSSCPALLPYTAVTDISACTHLHIQQLKEFLGKGTIQRKMPFPQLSTTNTFMLISTSQNSIILTVVLLHTSTSGILQSHCQRSRKQENIVERLLQKVCARAFENLINIHWWRHHFRHYWLSLHVACTSSNALFSPCTMHTPHASKGRCCLMIFIVFGSPHLSRRGYNNSEYYYDRRKSAAAMAYLAAAAPTPLTVQIRCFSRLNLQFILFSYWKKHISIANGILT